MEKLNEIKFSEIKPEEILSSYVELSKSKWKEGGEPRAEVIGPYIIALAVLTPLLFLLFGF
jgi:hypothetical protein